MSGTGQSSRQIWSALDQYPMATPPPGAVPDFDHPKYVGKHMVTIASAICLFAILLFSAIRFYAKVHIARKWNLDDYFFALSLPLAIAWIAIYVSLDNGGVYGYRMWEIRLGSLTQRIMMDTMIANLIFPLLTWLVKTTLFCLILTAFKPMQAIRLLCYTGIAVTGIYYTVATIMIGWTCGPRGGADRISFLIYTVSQAVFNVLSDFYILILPLPVVARLRLPLKRKIGVYCIFLAGSAACAMSILGLVFRIMHYDHMDYTTTLPLVTVTIIELSVGMIVSCIAPASKVVYHIYVKASDSLRGTALFSRFSHDRSYIKATEGEIEKPRPRKKHTPGGLSEIDSMKTFGTIEEESSSITATLKASSTGSQDTEDT